MAKRLRNERKQLDITQEKMAAIAERLTEERKRLGLTQEQMAAIAGVTTRTYGNYEAQGGDITAISLLALAAIGVDILYILLGKYAVLSQEEQEILAGYRLLDRRGRAGIWGILSGMNAPAVRPHVRGKQYVAGDGQYVEGNALTVHLGKKKKH